MQQESSSGDVQGVERLGFLFYTPYTNTIPIQTCHTDEGRKDVSTCRETIALVAGNKIINIINGE